MKTKNSNTSKKEKKSEPLQDLYSIYKSSGLPNELILSLGYVGLNDNVLDKLPVERRQHLFWISTYLHTVISESMKKKEKRDIDKLCHFLQCAMYHTDQYYEKTDDGITLFHDLNPHNQVFERNSTIDSKNKE